MKRQSTTLKITLGHIATLSSFIDTSDDGVMIRHKGQWFALLSVSGRIGTLGHMESNVECSADLTTCTIHRTTLDQVLEILESYVDKARAEDLANREDDNGPIRMRISTNRAMMTLWKHGVTPKVSCGWILVQTGIESFERVARERRGTIDAGVMFRWLNY